METNTFIISLWPKQIKPNPTMCMTKGEIQWPIQNTVFFFSLFLLLRNCFTYSLTNFPSYRGYVRQYGIDLLWLYFQILNLFHHQLLCHHAAFHVREQWQQRGILPTTNPSLYVHIYLFFHFFFLINSPPDVLLKV